LSAKDFSILELVFSVALKDLLMVKLQPPQPCLVGTFIYNKRIVDYLLLVLVVADIQNFN
jgi:hypothetical protein